MRSSEWQIRTSRSGGTWLHACLIGLIMSAGATLSHARDLAACIHRRVTFDGIVRLHYATVKASSGPRLYLHANYPQHCTPRKQESCPARAHLVPGNAVAIGKQCGRWDYVQYIGERRILKGWVQSGAFSPIPPPPSPKPPVIKMGSKVIPSPSPRRYQFKLTKGKGTPVCEAYLQRLNQTEFYNPPYCGRPESTLVPGFALLHRRYLTWREFNAIYFDAEDVLNHEPPNWGFKTRRNSDGSISLIRPQGPEKRDFKPYAWTYYPPVDIQNSGQGDNVILWTVDDRDFYQVAMCGESTGANDRGRITIPSAGLVVSPGGTTINRWATDAVFGVSDLPRSVSDTYAEFSATFSVFRYRNLNYYDAFLGGRRQFVVGFGRLTRSPLQPKLIDTLAVFLYDHAQRREVCEYYVPGLGDFR